MTDLELTRLCAEAMDLHINDKQRVLVGRCETSPVYDPLHDDAQAMALVSKFRLGLGPTHGGKWRAWIAYSSPDPSIPEGDTPARAICECVAKMQAAKGTA